jgi:hypothetical protein
MCAHLALIFVACGFAGSVLVDAGRAVVYRNTWFEGVATVEQVNVSDAGRTYRLSFPWKSEMRQAWTERDAGDPQPGDRIQVYINEDDLTSVAMEGWAWDNRFQYLARLAAAGLVSLGVALRVRYLWRKPEPPRRILRPRGNPGLRRPPARKRRRRSTIRRGSGPSHR